MKIEMTKENLVATLNIVQKAISNKSPMPALSGVKLTATKNAVQFMGTDLTMGILSVAPATVIEDGEVVIPARYLLDIARKLPSGNVLLEEKENAILIKYGKSKATLSLLDKTTYPSIPTVENAKPFTISAEQFSKMIRQTLIAIGHDENRPTFCGVNLQTKGSEFRLSTTNCFQLAQYKCQLDETLPENNVIIHGDTMDAVNKLLNGVEKVRINIEKNQAMFILGKTIIITRLIDGEFPDFSQVIPTEHKMRIKVNATALREATERVALICNEGTAVKYKIEKGLIPTILLKSNTEVGSINEEIPIELEGEEELLIAFQPKYIIPGLKTIEGKDVHIEFNTKLHPAVIKKAIPEAGEDYLYLVLPMRIL